MYMLTTGSHDNRAFSGINQGLNYSTASPTPTSVSGQGNSPVRAPFSTLTHLCVFYLATLSPILIFPGRTLPPNLFAYLLTFNTHESKHLGFLYNYSTMATLTDNDRGNTQPVCQNCSTSTTPLWRRDEIGSVLCNACGLFLKLHGRPRPISLKTDVIKSRNRVKSSGQGQRKRVSFRCSICHQTLAHHSSKSLFNGNGPTISRSEAGTPPPGSRRVSQKSSGTSDRSNSPISRTTTPAILHHSNIAPQHFFDNPPLGESPFAHSPSLPAFHLRQPSPSSTASLNDRHLELPHTYDALHQANTSLKTRISELEVINGLYKGRVQELERLEPMQNELRQALEQAHDRENELKRRLDDLEREVASLRKGSPNHTLTKRRLDIEGDLVNPSESSPPFSKRTRISDSSNYSEASQHHT